MSTSRLRFSTASQCPSSPFDYKSSCEWDPIKILEIKNPLTGTWTCPGFAPSKGRRCQWEVDPGNSIRALELLQALPDLVQSTSDVEPLLREIAALLLCNIRYHRIPHINQMDSVVEIWSTKNSTQRSHADNSTNGRET